MSVEEKVVRFFSEKGLTIASAESCTGGLISKRITDISGASLMYGYGLCTYANEAKMKLLKVNEDTLAKYGAVSSQVAAEMASGLLELSEADVAICTTGMASPGWQPTDKPVGMVFIGVSSKLGTRTVELSLGHLGTRDKIRNASTDRALEEGLAEAMKLCESK